MNDEKAFFNDFRATLSDQPWNYLETSDPEKIKKEIKSKNVDLSSSSSNRKQLMSIYTEILQLIKAKQSHIESQKFDSRLDIATHDFKCSCARKFNVADSLPPDSCHESKCSSRGKHIETDSIAESLYSGNGQDSGGSVLSSFRSHSTAKREDDAKTESRLSSIPSCKDVESYVPEIADTPRDELVSELYRKISSVVLSDSQESNPSIEDDPKEHVPSPRSLVESLLCTSTEDSHEEIISNDSLAASIRSDGSESVRSEEASVHAESLTSKEESLVDVVAVEDESISEVENVSDDELDNASVDDIDDNGSMDKVDDDNTSVIDVDSETVEEDEPVVDMTSIRTRSLSVGDSVKESLHGTVSSCESEDVETIKSSIRTESVELSPVESPHVDTPTVESPVIDESLEVESPRSEAIESSHAVSSESESLLESPVIEKSSEMESPHTVSPEGESPIESPMIDKSSETSEIEPPVLDSPEPLDRDSLDSPRIVSSDKESVMSESVDSPDDLTSEESEDESVLESPAIDKPSGGESLISSESESDRELSETPKDEQVTSDVSLDSESVHTLEGTSSASSPIRDQIDANDGDSSFTDTESNISNDNSQLTDSVSFQEDFRIKHMNSRNTDLSSKQSIGTEFSTYSSKSRIIEKMNRITSGNAQERGLQADLVQLLETVPILSSLPRERLFNLSNYFQLKSYFSNSAIILAGEVPKEFFILASGTASSYIYNGSNRPNIFKRSYCSSDYFGEMEVIQNCTSPDYVFAESHVTVQSISADDFRILLGDLFPAFISRASSRFCSLSSEVVVKESLVRAVDVIDGVEIFLESLPIISNLPNLDKVANKLSYDQFTDKEVIGIITKSNRFFMIYRGTISVQTFDDESNRQFELFTLGPGMFISSVLLSEISDVASNSSFVAYEKVILLSLDYKDFKKYLGEKVSELKEYLELFYKSGVQRLATVYSDRRYSLNSMDSLCNSDVMNSEVESLCLSPSKHLNVKHKATLPFSDEDTNILPLYKKVGDGMVMSIRNVMENSAILTIEDVKRSTLQDIERTISPLSNNVQVSLSLNYEGAGVSNSTDQYLTSSIAESCIEYPKPEPVATRAVGHTAEPLTSLISSSSLGNSSISELECASTLPMVSNDPSHSIDCTIESNSNIDMMEELKEGNAVLKINFGTMLDGTLEKGSTFVPELQVEMRKDEPVVLGTISNDSLAASIRSDGSESVRSEEASVHAESLTSKEESLVDVVAVEDESISEVENVSDDELDNASVDDIDDNGSMDKVDDDNTSVIDVDSETVEEDEPVVDMTSIRTRSLSVGDSVKESLHGTVSSCESEDVETIKSSIRTESVELSPVESPHVDTPTVESPVIDESLEVESPRSEAIESSHAVSSESESLLESPVIEKSSEMESPHTVSPEGESPIESPMIDKSSETSEIEPPVLDSPEPLDRDSLDSPRIVSSDKESVMSESVDSPDDLTSEESEDESVLESPAIDKPSGGESLISSESESDRELSETPKDEQVTSDVSLDSESVHTLEGTSSASSPIRDQIDANDGDSSFTDTESNISNDNSQLTDSPLVHCDSEDDLVSSDNAEDLESIIPYDEETLMASKMLLLSTLKNKYKSLGAAFVSMDADRSGVVSRDEFLDFINRLGIGAIEEGELYMLYEMLRGPDEDSLTFSSFYMNSGEKVNTLAEFNIHLIQLFGSSRVAFERYFGSLKRNTTCSRTDFTMLAANVGIVEPEVSILFHELDICRNGYVTVMTILKMVVGDWDRDVAIEHEKKATSSYGKFVNYIQKGDARDFNKEFSKSISMNFFDSNVDGSLITSEMEEFVIYDELKHFDVISCALLSHEPFSSLSLSQRRYVASLLLIREVDANECIMDKGDVHELYIVLEGNLTMHYRAYLYDSTLELNVGEFCNLDSFIQSQPTQSTVTCTTSAIVGVMTAECYKYVVWPIIEMRIKRVPVITQFLRSIESFNLFNDQELDRIACASTIRSFKLHETIIKKGDVPNWFYIIFEGSATIVPDKNLETSKRTSVEKMNHICARDLMENCNHKFALIANSKVVLLAWERTEFFRVFNKTGAIVKNDACKMDFCNKYSNDPKVSKRMSKRVSFVE